MTAVTEWILAVAVVVVAFGVAFWIASGLTPNSYAGCAEACGAGNVASLTTSGCVCVGSAP